jgi:hypothetical protein
MSKLAVEGYVGMGYADPWRSANAEIRKISGKIIARAA